jgi:tetratricopeptide (TPR) repeat protein
MAGPMAKSDSQIQDLLSRREFALAEPLIRERLEQEPGSADAYYLKGVFHYFQGQLKPTVESLRKALSLDPQHTDAAIWLSVRFNDIGKYDDAKQVFEQANQSVDHRRTAIPSCAS